MLNKKFMVTVCAIGLQLSCFADAPVTPSDNENRNPGVIRNLNSSFLAAVHEAHALRHASSAAVFPGAPLRRSPAFENLLDIIGAMMCDDESSDEDDLTLCRSYATDSISQDAQPHSSYSNFAPIPSAAISLDHVEIPSDDENTADTGYEEERFWITYLDRPYQRG